MIRLDAIQKIIAQKAYWSAKAGEAYQKGDEAAFRYANGRVGNLLMPFERLTGRRWDKDRGGINDACWR